MSNRDETNYGLPNAKRLRLRDAPARAMWPAVELLSRWIDPRHLRLGGGTALEARWHHRDSTDLDFFCAGEHANGVFYGHMHDMMADMRRFAAQGRISVENLRVRARSVVHFRIGLTPASFGRTDVFHDDPRDEVEASTGIVLSGTRDILVKKMHNRLGHNYDATERDAYDFAVARTLAPQDLLYAWETLHDELKPAVVELYREVEANPPPTKLKDAAYPVLAGNLWAQVLEMFETDLRYAPSISTKAR